MVDESVAEAVRSPQHSGVWEAEEEGGICSNIHDSLLKKKKRKEKKGGGPGMLVTSKSPRTRAGLWSAKKGDFDVVPNVWCTPEHRPLNRTQKQSLSKVQPLDPVHFLAMVKMTMCVHVQVTR